MREVRELPVTTSLRITVRRWDFLFLSTSRPKTASQEVNALVVLVGNEPNVSVSALYDDGHSQPGRDRPRSGEGCLPSSDNEGRVASTVRRGHGGASRVDGRLERCPQARTGRQPGRRDHQAVGRDLADAGGKNPRSLPHRATAREETWKQRVVDQRRRPAGVAQGPHCEPG